MTDDEMKDCFDYLSASEDLKEKLEGCYRYLNCVTRSYLT